MKSSILVREHIRRKILFLLRLASTKNLLFHSRTRSCYKTYAPIYGAFLVSQWSQIDLESYVSTTSGSPWGKLPPQLQSPSMFKGIMTLGGLNDCLRNNPQCTSVSVSYAPGGPVKQDNTLQEWLQALPTPLLPFNSFALLFMVWNCQKNEWTWFILRKNNAPPLFFKGVAS